MVVSLLTSHYAVVMALVLGYVHVWTYVTFIFNVNTFTFCRYDRFIDAFEHVANMIDDIYKVC